MSALSDSAGDWHKDGTRDHHIIDDANVLVVAKTMTNEHYDLQVRSTTGKDRLYRWSREVAVYVAQK